MRLVDILNGYPSIFTTSSCSGRLSVFGDRSINTPEQKRKGGEWVYATHDEPDAETVIGAVTERLEEGNLGTIFSLQQHRFLCCKLFPCLTKSCSILCRMPSGLTI